MSAIAYHTTTRQSTDSPQKLKQDVDVRDFYLSEVGTGKRSGEALSDHVPWRNDRKPSLSIWHDGWKDWATGETGDIFTLVERLHNLNFSQAVEYVAERVGGSATPIRRQSLHKTLHSHVQAREEPPSAEAQRKALAVVERGEQQLWLPIGTQALDYLHRRSLVDDTIRKTRKGYASTATMDRLFHGKYSRSDAIIIPWFIGPDIWAVKFRRLTPGDDPKYVQLSGLNQAGALYGADQIKPGLPFAFLEGEFDVDLAQQLAGDLTNFVTLGSVTNRLATRWVDLVKGAPRCILAHDNDDAGKTNADKNTAGLPDGHLIVTVPEGKDPTEYVVDHAGDLRTWISEVLRMPLQLTGVSGDTGPIWPTPPDSWRAALGEYLPDSLAPLVEKLAAAGHLVAGQTFSRQDALGLDLSRSTVDRGLEAGESVCWSRITVLPIDSSLQEKTPQAPICKSVIGVQYRVFSLAEITTNLLKRAACRIWEHCHPTDPDKPVGKPRPGFFEALGYTASEAVDLAAQVDAVLQPIYQRQGNAERFTERQASGIYSRLKRSLHDLTSTPLPAGWTYRNATEYRAVIARAIKEAQPERNLSLKDWSKALGVSPRAVPTYLQRAGIESVATFQERAITSADQVQRIGYEIKGYPRRMTVAATGQQPKEYRYDPEQLVGELSAGHQVVVKFQTANQQRIATDTQPEQAIAAKSVEKSTTGESGQPKPTIAAPRPKPPAPYFGPGYDPAYVRAYLVQACALVKGYHLHSTGCLVDRSTGEIIADQPDARTLVSILTGQELPESTGDALLDFVTADLGGQVESISVSCDTEGEAV